MNERILVVDDDPHVGDFIRKTLEREGYSVFQASDGQEALKIIEREPVLDLVIADIIMPGMDGYELLKTIRQEYETRVLPFVFLTAKGSTEEVIEGWDSGANYYITKPCSSEVLRSSVHLVLAEIAKRLIGP